MVITCILCSSAEPGYLLCKKHSKESSAAAGWAPQSPARATFLTSLEYWGVNEHSLREIPPWLRELSVSEVKQFTFSNANKTKWGCIKTSSTLSEQHTINNSKTVQFAPWSFGKHQWTRNESREITRGLTSFCPCFNRSPSAALYRPSFPARFPQKAAPSHTPKLHSLFSLHVPEQWHTRQFLKRILEEQCKVKSTNIEPNPESPSNGGENSDSPDWKPASEYLGTEGFYN